MTKIVTVGGCFDGIVAAAAVADFAIKKDCKLIDIL